jgi:formate hydrogenlyase subunit 6/NADH:ubiquinone oxidoreductase subunit I
LAFEISEECLVCGVCMDECPVEAISEGDDTFVIDAGECTDCGACAEVCPNEAISES